MKMTLKKVLSIVIAFTLVFGTVAFGFSDVDWSELAVWAEAIESSIKSSNTAKFNLSGNVATPATPGEATPAEPVKTVEGKCGENVYWTFYENSGCLVIGGSGDMYNYTNISGEYYYKNFLPSDVKEKVVEVVIKSGVTSIGDYAFCWCPMEKITISNTVKRIGNQVFVNCDNLTEIAIPASVESLGYHTFLGIENLKKITVDPGNKYFSSDNNGVLFNKDKSTLLHYPGGKSDKIYVMPDSVKVVKTGAFYGCVSLENITFSNKLTDIEEGAFESCGLTEINLPESLINIGEEAFCGTAIDNVTIPDNVKNIGMLAFWHCNNLSSVTIPNSVEAIGYAAFHDTAFYNNEENWVNDDLYIGKHLIDTKNSDVETYAIKEGTKTIATDALGDLKAKTIIIPESVVDIGGVYEESPYYPKYAERYVVDENNQFYSTDDSGVLYNKDKTELIIYPAGKTETTFSVPDSVKVISEYAFYNCEELLEIDIPDSVEKIGINALKGTGYFKDEANWENGVLYAGKCLVSAKTDISGKYVIRYGTKSISDIAFQSCKKITEIIIPNEVEEIGAGAFNGCSSLKEIILPEGVKKLGFNAFASCEKLGRVHIPSSITYIENNTPFHYTIIGGITPSLFSYSTFAFICSPYYGDYCYLKNFAKENGLKFEVCEASPEQYQNGYYYIVSKHNNAIIVGTDESINGDVVIPTELGGYPVTSLKEGAFKLHRDITSITIQKNITYIEAPAIYLCYGLKYIYVDADNPSYSSDENGVLFNKDKTELIQYPIGNTRTSYEIPNTVKRICNSAFFSVDGLLSEDLNFYPSGYLKNVIIPDSVKDIEDGAFAWTLLESAVIPDSVVNIEGGVFQGCLNLKTVHIGKGVSTIGRGVFLYCRSLSEITVDDENMSFSSDKNGILFNKDKTVLLQCPSAIDLEQYTIPDTVEEIGYLAFISCLNLRRIIIPSGVKTIATEAFCGCKNLKDIYIPKSITAIKENAFGGCKNLTDIYYEGTEEEWDSTDVNYRTLGEFEFSKEIVRFNSNISSLPTLPDEPVTEPEKIYTGKCGENVYWTLDETTGVLTVYGNGSMEESTWYREPASPWSEHAEKITEAVVEEGVTTLSANAFDGCVNLKKISLPQSLKVIGARAFNSCESLTEIVIPDKVERIERHAFQSCRSLEKINIPESVVFIGSNILNNSPCGRYDEDGALYIDNCLIDFEDFNSAVKEEYEVKNGTRLIAFETFGNCEYIRSVRIPESVQYVSDDPFGYDRLTSITVDPNNKYFTSEDNVLFNKDKTVLIAYLCGNPNESYTIPDSVKVIGDYAFLYCFNLKEIIIPSGVTKIGYAALAGTAVTNFDIPDTVTSIGTIAFAMNESIRSIYIPASVSEIGSRPFLWCFSLEEIIVDPSNPYYSNDSEGVLFNKDKTVLLEYPMGRVKTDYVVPESVEKIEAVAFNDISKITKITLQKNISEIGYGAFNACTSLSEVYYTGTENDWNSIKIDELNSPLLNADIHYNSVLEDTPDIAPEGTTKPDETTTEPIATETSTTKPVEIPTTTKPVVTEPSTTKPVEVPSTTKPVVTEPSTTKPAVTEPSTTKPAEVPSTEKNVKVEIRKPSQTEIVYGDSIILHADVENMPEGAKIIWTSDNGNFTITQSAENGRNCVVTPSSSGETVFVATLIDADGNTLASDTQSLTAKAGFFQKIIAFFKKIFGMTKVIPEAVKF